MTTRPMRKYQAEAVDAIERDWRSGTLRTALSLPTGTGKTRVAAEICKRKHVKGTRIVFAAHRFDLLKHMADDLEDVAPWLSVGYVKAELDDVDADVVLCSIQTLANQKRRGRLTDVALVIIDEAHHAAAPSYIETLTYLGCYDETPALGLSATLTRNDELGLGDVWQKVSFSRDIDWAIASGWIVPYRRHQVPVEKLDLAEVKVGADGEWEDESLGLALVNADTGKQIAAKYRELAADRRGVVFCPSVGSALVIADDFRAAGFTAAVVHGKIPQAERDQIYADARAGLIQVLINVMVLTEGFDDPGISCVVNLRLTKSQSLFIQMVGRGLRLDDGKVDCVVINAEAVTLTLETRADLKRTVGRALPVPKVKITKPAGSPRTTIRRPVLAPATYRVRVEGLTVTLYRTIADCEEMVARRNVTRAADAARMGQLLAKADQQKRIVALAK